MNRILKTTAGMIMLAICLAGQCDPPQPGQDLLQAREWMQLQGDRPGTGFNAVHTSATTPSSRKWSRQIGNIAFSSPVVSPQGEVWVGTTAGELFGLNKETGEIIHQHDAGGGSIVSTPAVDQDGKVYFLSQHTDSDKVTSQLQVFDPDSNSLTAFQSDEDFQSTSSPKIWRDFVFVCVLNDVIVFDRRTNAQIARRFCCQSDLCTEGNFITDFVNFVSNIGSDYTPPVGQIPEPSVAIVENPAIVGDADHPIIVMAGFRHLTAMRFDPAGETDFDKLQVLWTQELQGFDCDADRLRITTPAVLDSEQVVVADHRNRVRSFLIHDGTKLWNTNVGAQIVCPPVASIRQMYVVTKDKFVILDSDGQEMARQPLNGFGGGAALSVDFVHVVTSHGVHTFHPDPDNETETFDAPREDFPEWNVTTPAIDSDGNLYVSTSDGFVQAYRHAQFDVAPTPPQITWVTPSDGQSIPFPAGQPLKVALSSGFSGVVTMDSSVDGALCNFQVDNASEVSCTTTHPLTLGEHVLTAFARGSNGGSKSAQITIQVVDAPPVVTITAPANDSAFADIAFITLTASVSDPDEPNFPANQVRWKSSIDGDLGSGLFIQHTFSTGDHTITVTATDSQGTTGEASIILHIFHD